MKELFSLNSSTIDKIDRFSPHDQGHYCPFDSFPHGAPLGGFGTGTIGRSPYGDFNIWHIKIGAHIEEEIKACSFHVYQKNSSGVYNNLLTTRPYKSKKLETFAEPISKKIGSYHATFPKSKYIFQDAKAPAIIECEQFSPILPNNYKESSFPIAIFEHKVTNPTPEPIEVSIMMTWANMSSWKFEDQRPGIQDNWYSFIPTNENRIHKISKTKEAAGIVLSSQKSGIFHEMDGELCIATKLAKDVEVSYQPYFYLNGTGQEITTPFYQNGKLTNKELVEMADHQSYGTALAVKVKLRPGQSKSIPFILTWDLPIVEFNKNDRRRKYYTKFFRETGTNSWSLAKIALENYSKWSHSINQWHNSIIHHSNLSKIFPNKNLNNYFKMLINELYFLVDGGTFWDADTGDFGILECFDYPFYETLDVRFYGSFPLLKFWPKIELNIMEKFSKTIKQVNSKMVRYNVYTDNLSLKLPSTKKERLLYYDQQMVFGSCPHDLGGAKNHPFKKINGYTWQNSNYWKDLNSKFVLLCYRDFQHTKDISFLKKCWPAIVSALSFLIELDIDQDGIPENSGYPDQTYDNWIMHGVSAYCGSLWLAALKSAVTMANLLDKNNLSKKYQLLFDKASKIFDSKLWNGHYYNFDETSDDIMAEQLIGQWYFDILHESSILPKSKIKKALKTIYRHNFLNVSNGHWGVLSGMKKNCQMVTSEQGRDIWVGANFALAGIMLRNGMEKEAYNILNTISTIIFEHGLFFRTPEGWNTKGEFTATMYMRPNAIWNFEF